MKDLVDIPNNVKQYLTIKPVQWIDQVLEIALEKMPVPLLKEIKVESITPLVLTTSKPNRRVKKVLAI
jgi:ATP-dependent Lon protease